MTSVGQRCRVCLKQAKDLPEGSKLLCCSRCKAAFYCSSACQRSDWQNGHKKEWRSTTTTPAVASCNRAASLLGAMSEMDKPCWGGALAQAESLSSRLHRVLNVPLSGRSYGERFAKSRELFRLGFNLYLERKWDDSVMALAEALLLEDKAMPQALAEVRLADGPSSCPFGKLVSTLCDQRKTMPEGWDLKLALIEVQWLDMQMLFARELCKRNEDNPEVASEHQSRWFDLLCSMDDLARKTIVAHVSKKAPDPRVLSRLTLVQALYGANPPLSRPAEECAKLAARAVSLWPQDSLARLWCDRAEDHEALLKLLEPDAPQREKLKCNTVVAQSSPSPKVEDLDLDEFLDEFKITGGDFVVLDGDHTEKDYDDVVEVGHGT